MTAAGVVLAGGRSRRMGLDKASLTIGDEAMLSRVVRLLSQVVSSDQIVCVAAASQELPRLPPEVRVLHDPSPDEGPLAALAQGLKEFREPSTRVIAAGCDTPLLSPELLRLLLNQATDAPAVVARVRGQLQPFPGVYDSRVFETAERLLHGGQRSLKSLLRECRPQVLEEETTRELDSELLSFLNCNTQVELEQVRSRLECSKPTD